MKVQIFVDVIIDPTNARHVYWIHQTFSVAVSLVSSTIKAPHFGT